MNRRILAVAGIVVAGLAGWFVLTRSGKAPQPPQEFLPATSPTSTWRESTISLDRLSDPTSSPQEKIKRVYMLVQNYAQATRRRGGPPLSSNREFTRALTGANPLRVQFLPPGHAAISPEGELLDSWNTPYFFHVLSADSVEVQSAGPDRVPFNQDDLVFPPPRPGTLQTVIRPKSMPRPEAGRPGAAPGSPAPGK